MTPARWVLAIIAGGTLVRLVLASVTGLGFDESYTMGNARQFSLSYVDHAPLHIWLMWITAKIAGTEASGVIRLPFVLLFAGSTWLMFVLTRRLFSDRAGLWAVIAFSLAPVFSLSHGSWALPDGPAIFFMLATAVVASRILIDEPAPERTTWLWIAAGALGGMAILAKYNAAFVFVGVLLYVLTVPSARRHLATPGPWLGTAAALILFSPVVIWNLEHELVGYFFQSRRVGGISVGLRLLVEDVAGQALYLTPWLFVPLAISIFTALKAGRSDRAGWLVALLAIGPIAVFTFFTLWSRGLPHWTMPGWLFAFPLFGRDAVALVQRRPQFARRYMGAVAAVFAIVIGFAALQATRGLFLPPVIGGISEPTTDLVDWTEVGDALRERGLIDDDPIVASPLWMSAGKVSYALGPDIPVVCVCGDSQHFRYRYDQTQWVGRDMAVIVPAGERNQWMWEMAGRFFDTLEPREQITIHRAGRPAVVLDVQYGRGLKAGADW